MEIAKSVRYLENLDHLLMGSDDAFEAQLAKNLIRGIIESNNYEVVYSKEMGTRIRKMKSDGEK